jgi:hypothetical protein
VAVTVAVAVLTIIAAVALEPSIIWPLRLTLQLVQPADPDMAVWIIGRWENLDTDNANPPENKTTFEFTPGQVLRSNLAGRELTSRWEAHGATLIVLPSITGELPMLRGTYRPELTSRLEFDVSFNDNRMTLMPRFDNEVFGSTPEGQPWFGRRGYVCQRSQSGLRVWFADLLGRSKTR